MGDSGKKKKAKKSVPTRFQRKALWMAITALALVVTGIIAVGAILLTGYILSFLQVVLVPLAVAGIIAYLLQPIIVWLTSRGWSHNRAMMVVFSSFMVAVVLLAVAVIVPTFGQAWEIYEDREKIYERFTELADKGITRLKERLPVAEKYYDRGMTFISEEGDRIAGEIGVWLWGRIRGALGFFAYVLGLLLVPIYLYYFLRNASSISQNWSNYLPLRASGFKDEVVGTLQEINQYLIAFFRGQMVVSMIDGAVVAICLLLIGLPYWLLLGVFLAILGLIPYIGNLMVMIPAVIIAIWHFGDTESGMVNGDEPAKVGEVVEIVVAGKGAETFEKTVVSVSDNGQTAEVLINAWNWLPSVWAYPLIVLGIFFVVQQVNGLVTAPKIVGESVGLHPLTVIFSVLFWSLLLGGLLGALLAVPLTASIKVLFKRYIWERRREPAGEGPPAGESPGAAPEPQAG